jgi:tyrosinase
LAEYEKALWSCGWDPKLGQPYWDWTLDAGSNATFLASPVFDKVRGFGGNGAFIPGNLSNPSPQIPDFVSYRLSSLRTLLSSP